MSQVGGLHLDKENIKYTPERLRNYLKSLVLPGDKCNDNKIHLRQTDRQTDR